MSKPVKSIKLTPGKQKQIQDAISLLREHYGDVVLSWGQLTPKQREEVLAHSLLLAALKRLTEPLGMVERGLGL